MDLDITAVMRLQSQRKGCADHVPVAHAAMPPRLSVYYAGGATLASPSVSVCGASQQIAFRGRLAGITVDATSTHNRWTDVCSPRGCRQQAPRPPPARHSAATGRPPRARVRRCAALPRPASVLRRAACWLVHWRRQMRLAARMLPTGLPSQCSAACTAP